MVWRLQTSGSRLQTRDFAPNDAPPAPDRGLRRGYRGENHLVRRLSSSQALGGRSALQSEEQAQPDFYSSGERDHWRILLPCPGRALICGIFAECANWRGHKPKMEIWHCTRLPLWGGKGSTSGCFLRCYYMLWLCQILNVRSAGLAEGLRGAGYAYQVISDPSFMRPVEMTIFAAYTFGEVHRMQTPLS